MPLFLFAVLFGLSMDYHVFLLSRIRERYRATGDNRDAIAHGVGSTGRIITGAALIIIAVFSGFARGGGDSPTPAAGFEADSEGTYRAADRMPSWRDVV